MKTRLIQTAKPTAILLAIGFAYMLFSEFTGLSLFCRGVSRMLTNLAHLRFYEAFSSNCVLFCLLPVFAAVMIRHAYLFIRYGKKGFSRAETVAAWVIVGILLAFAVVRNIWRIDILIP